jgi:hypothetical protein
MAFEARCVFVNKSIKRIFNRRPVITPGLGKSFECDLIDFSNIKDSNNKYSYILLVIDQFSRYLWGRKLIRKAPSFVAKQMREILQESGACYVLFHDAGSEWKGDFQTLMDEYKIKTVTRGNELHANFVERAIGSLKTRLFRYFEFKQTRKWTNVFQSFIQSYNATFHRTLQAKPIDITPETEVTFWIKQYYKTPKIEKKDIKKETKKVETKIGKQVKSYKFPIGSYVRLTKLRGPFDKKSTQGWTREIFKIVKRTNKNLIPLYVLEDLNQEILDGTFYGPELQRVTYNPEELYKVETILKTKGKGKNKKVLVKWLGYNKSFNQWIKAKDIEDINN